MKYFLDTNICIYALKNKFPAIREKIRRLSASEIAIPSMVKAELYYGAMKSDRKEKVLNILDDFLAPFEVIPFGEKELKIYAEIRAHLEKKGHIIGPNDLIIAATTLARHATLITNNTKEFQRVQGLRVENWTA